MDESGKQPASEVDSDPTIVASPTNPIKKGKRGPKEVVETEVLGSKKQKIVNGDVEQAVGRKNFETETQETTKEEQTSSSKEYCSSQSEEEQNEENDKMVSQPIEVPSGAVESGTIDKKEVEVPSAIKAATTSQDGKRDSSFNESEEDGDDNSKKDANQHLETPKKCVEVPPTKKSAATTQGAKGASSSNESEEKDGDDNSKVDDEHLETRMKSDTDVEMFDASSVNKTPQTPITSQATGSKTLLMSNLSFMIKEEDVRIFFKNVGQIAEVHFDMKDDYFTGQGHVEFTTAEAAQEALRLNNELLLDQPVRLDLARERGGHSATTLATGSKTLYLGNLSFSIEEDDVKDFFKDVGEIAAIRFAIRDDKFLGYGHIEFTTAEAAQEALKLNNKVILDRHVKLDLARERGAYTPGSSMEKSNQKGGQAHGKTIFVRGFDSSDGFDNIRSSLEKHFGKCGEISRISIPKDYESGTPKGVAFIDFVDSNGFSQALELDGSEVGGSMITVQEAKNQRPDSREGSGHGGRGWGGGNGYGGGWGGRSASGGGQSGSGGRWAGENGSGGGRATGSGSGGGWGTESGTGGRWASARDRESGSGGRWGSGSGYGGGRGSGSGYSSGLDRESGSAGGWGTESGYVSGRGREHGSGGRWASGRDRESGYGGGSGSGSGYGGGRGSGSGYGGGRGSGSGYDGSGRSREGDYRSGWSRGYGSGGGWSRGGGSGGGWGGESGSAGGWGGRSGRGFSSSHGGRFSGSHGSNNEGASSRP
ncbi:hypothetical protein L6452_19399 [Arctium lappa]|uniref:Uncharacterized protein n=1 Tax=Arctium lappa TaxID=4217 RepID=A0ACB9BCW4_ARCLA|nr:hypothetical protein L6452_19399 [Arctium lappa]